MKTYLFFILALFSIYGMSQTDNNDIDFIFGDFLVENYGDYVVENKGVWGLKDDNNIKRSVKFKLISKGSIRKAMVLIYQEFNENSLLKQEVFFIPEKQSTSVIWERSLQLINGISDENQLKAIFWAMMNYSSNIN